MEQLALFGPPEPLPEPMNIIDIPVATDVNAYSVSLRGAPEPYITEIEGVTYEVCHHGVIYMHMGDGINGSISFSDIQHPHWKWHSIKDGCYTEGLSESRVAAHKEIFDSWGKEWKPEVWEKEEQNAT